MYLDESIRRHEDTAIVLTRHLVQFIKALQRAVFSILY